MKGNNKNLSNEKRRKRAFTLAEALIAIAIIGVVAALTIVPLVKNYQEKAFVNKLKETYSILSQAHNLAVVEHGDPTTWNIGGSGWTPHINLSEYYKPYLKIEKDCGTSNTQKCFSDGVYKAMFNNAIDRNQDMSKTWLYYPRIQLVNGASIAFYSPSSCTPSSNNCGGFIVDINGAKPPNRAGVDYFWFYINPVAGVKPTDPNSIENCASWCCAYQNTTNTNGGKCAGWVIRKGNMDYLRRDISNEW